MITAKRDVSGIAGGHMHSPIAISFPVFASRVQFHAWQSLLPILQTVSLQPFSTVGKVRCINAGTKIF